MRAAPGRWPGLSLLLLLVAVLACPRHAAGNFGDIREETQEPMDTNDTDVNTTITTITATETSNESTTTTDDVLTTIATTGDGSTTTATTGDGLTTSTEDPGTEPPTNASLPTDTTPSTTTQSPIDDLNLYEQTQAELKVTDGILTNFSSIVSPEDVGSRSEGVLDRPAGWWRLSKAQTEEVEPLVIDNFCVEINPDPECEKLWKNLDELQNLVTILTLNIDAWNLQNLMVLETKNEELHNSFIIANGNRDKFKESIDIEKFRAVITVMDKQVKASQDAVGNKIDNIKSDRTGSVVVVAVIGSIGGLMIVGLAGVMVYGATRKQKMKKKSSTTPYNKLQGENIPIDAFLSDAPPRDLSHIPRADPYASQQPPPSRGDPYASSYGGRSEPASEYRGQPRITRVGKALPRTHF